MANAVRIVVGLAGLIWAGWSAVRVMRARRAGEDGSFVAPFGIMTATAVAMALTLLI